MGGGGVGVGGDTRKHPSSHWMRASENILTHGADAKVCARVGSDVELTCSLKNPISWERQTPDGTFDTIVGRISIRPQKYIPMIPTNPPTLNEGTWILLVKQVVAADGGVYRCKAQLGERRVE